MYAFLLQLLSLGCKLVLVVHSLTSSHQTAITELLIPQVPYLWSMHLQECSKLAIPKVACKLQTTPWTPAPPKIPYLFSTRTSRNAANSSTEAGVRCNLEVALCTFSMKLLYHCRCNKHT